MVATAPRALFAWPSKSAVARPVAKAKIYAHAKPTAALRALFVEQIESITWAYKLAPETISLPATPGVPEIEVFEIALKLPDIDHGLLRCRACTSSFCANTWPFLRAPASHCAINWIGCRFCPPGRRQRPSWKRVSPKKNSSTAKSTSTPNCVRFAASFMRWPHEQTQN